MKLRNGNEVQVKNELLYFERITSNDVKNSRWTIFQLLKTPDLRKPLLCVVTLNAAQQLVGINAVSKIYY